MNTTTQELEMTSTLTSLEAALLDYCLNYEAPMITQSPINPVGLIPREP